MFTEKDARSKVMKSRDIGDEDVKKMCSIHLFINCRIFIEKRQDTVTDTNIIKLDGQNAPGFMKHIV